MDGQLSSSASLSFKFLKKILFEIMCMYVSLYMCVSPWVQCLWRPEEGRRSPGSVVTETWEPPILVLGTEFGIWLLYNKRVYSLS